MNNYRDVQMFTNRKIELIEYYIFIFFISQVKNICTTVQSFGAGKIYTVKD